MTETDPAGTAQLSHRAKLAAWACRTAAICLPLAVLLSWLFGGMEAAALARLGLPVDHVISTAQRAAAIPLSLLPGMAVAAALLHLATCFEGFARGAWFGAGQPRALAATGRWLIAAGALSLVVPTLLGLTLSLNAAPGGRVLALSLSSDGLLAILFGFAFWSLGRLWSTARTLAAENAAFV